MSVQICDLETPRLRDLRPGIGEVILMPHRDRQRVCLIEEVVERVAYPCRWFVYDHMGDGYPVEPAGERTWRIIHYSAD